MPALFTGGCQCGAVRYALHAMPEDVHLCHCRMCQKAVGGPFAALAPVRLTHFAWTRGTPGVFDSSNTACRHYCRDCGTPLSFGYRGSDFIDLTIGSLDRPDLVVPQRQYGTEGRLPWLTGSLLDRLPQGETPALVGAVPAPVVSYQHPDHDTPPDWAPPACGRSRPVTETERVPARSQA